VRAFADGKNGIEAKAIEVFSQLTNTSAYRYTRYPCFFSIACTPVGALSYIWCSNYPHTISVVDT